MKLELSNDHEKIKLLIYMISKIKQRIILLKKTPIAKLCTKILNDKLKILGILNKNQCILSKVIKTKNFLRRKISNILKSKFRNLSRENIIHLFKKKKIIYNGLPVTSLNKLIDLNKQKCLEIKIH